MDIVRIPKEFVNNESSYQNSSQSMLAAIEILEKAQTIKERNNEEIIEQKEEGFWDKIIKPFKCGK